MGWSYPELQCHSLGGYNQCLCTGWNSSGTAFGIDVMQCIYVDEDRRDFNSPVDEMILSPGITVPVLSVNYRK